jgi:hypothetical protein
MKMFLKKFFILWCSCLFLLLAGCNNNDQPKAKIGDVGILRGTRTLVAVAISEAAFDEWLDAQIAKDTEGQAQMLVIGTILGIKNGTKVRLIDYGGIKYGVFKKKIRILEGPKWGRTGWVSEEDIKPLQESSK